MKTSFFRAVSPAEFTDLLRSFPILGTETVDLDQAIDRVLGIDLVASEDLPLVARSCMDGYAVRAVDLFGASESAPSYLDLRGSLQIREISTEVLAPGTCLAITTGGTLPPGADAVVMVEHTDRLDETTIEVRRPLAPGENVMLRGEDVITGTVALTAGTRIRVQEAGLLAALGQTEVVVRRRPRVAIISTGDELVPVNGKPVPGQVRDVNSVTLAGLVRAHGGLPLAMGIVPDRFEDLAQALARALDQADVACLSGGSSVGTRDLTVNVIEARSDSEILAHGVTISPGKPTILARCGNTPVLGLPGQVTSAQVVMLVFGGPLLWHLQGRADAFDSEIRPIRPAVLSRNLASKPGREDYVRVALEPATEGRSLAVPVTGKSGLLRTLLDAQGLLTIPASCEGLTAGSPVNVWMI
ncbi:MAG: molybdopterin molybdenumtransferase MoeA [Deltaproteobacteria bacterium]|nr:molybdopterin molybdenumtransferase MoeA [Deltaproteobacteria bacterium]